MPRRHFYRVIVLVLVHACTDDPATQHTDAATDPADTDAGATTDAGDGDGDGDGDSPVEVTPRIGVSVSGGCAIAAGQLACWGGDAAGAWQAPELEVSSVSASLHHFCVADGAGGGSCFSGPNGNGPPGDPKSFPDGAALSEVRTGEYAMVALTEAGAFVGVEHGAGNDTPAPGVDAVLVDVAGSGAGFCGIRKDDGKLVCWPQFVRDSFNPCDSRDGAHHELEPPDGTYLQIEAGQFHFCAIATDHSVHCWGAGAGDTPECAEEPVHRGQTAAPAGEFQYVSAGWYHSCGVRKGGTLACWGAGTELGECGDELDCGQADPPEGSDFVQVAAAYTHSCGLTRAGKVVCWGSDTFGRSTPPDALAP